MENINLNQPTLFLMCGLPGSGKSTYAKKLINDDHNAIYVSRDEVRFSIISENEEYFSHENEVFREFIRQIQKGLDGGYDVIADATHLNERSRNKTLKALRLKGINICIIAMDIPLEVCLQRNENRKGLGRTYVPPSVIKNMSKTFKLPTKNEKIHYNNIVKTTR